MALTIARKELATTITCQVPSQKYHYKNVAIKLLIAKIGVNFYVTSIKYFDLEAVGNVNEIGESSKAP